MTQALYAHMNNKRKKKKKKNNKKENVGSYIYLLFNERIQGTFTY
jgi:hypothetical protein